MKLVKFKNGKYGVRKTTIFGYYFLSTSGYFWRKNRALDFEIEHTKEKAISMLNLLTDTGLISDE